MKVVGGGEGGEMRGNRGEAEDVDIVAEGGGGGGRDGGARHCCGVTGSCEGASSRRGEEREFFR